jgi:hypothetical protein
MFTFNCVDLFKTYGIEYLLTIVSPLILMPFGRMTRCEDQIRLLLYTPVSEGVGEQLRRMIEKLVPKNNVEIYRSVESLSLRLRQPADDLPIAAVLLAARRGDLTELLSIRDLLRDIRIILVLPDRDEDTIAKGHTFRPRFVSYTDGNFMDVCFVLEKMI